MREYQFLNTGKVVTLERLAGSFDVQNRTIIEIYDKNGKFLTRGKWFDDNILDYMEMVGTATTAGKGLTIRFNECD